MIIMSKLIKGGNNYGQLGNGTYENTTEKVFISQVKLNTTPKVINYKKAGDSGKQIEYTVSAGFNLLYDTIDQGDCEFKTLDSDVATVDEDGVVTATGVGTTYIRIYNKQNDCYAAVKVQVNGEQGLTTAKIVGGWNHFVALKANGEVWTWGSNSNGQLGVSDKTNKQKPTKTSIYDSNNEDNNYAIDVAAGYQFTAILKNDGTVWMSGNNGYGQLADGTTTSSNTFKKANISDVIAISAGSSTMHALKKDGTVWSWGLNSYGEYGNNATSSLANYVPCKMSKIPNIMQLASGESHIAMIAADGSVWAVGRNGEGQLGLGNTTDIYVPTQMVSKTGSGILTGVKEISCNIYSTSLITDSGDVYAVGQNNYGQLATKDTQNKSVIVPMLDSSSAQLKNVNHIYSAGYATFATKNENGLYVTGYASCAQNFTQSTSTRKYLYKTQENKKIIAMALTRSTGKQTGIIVDDKGYIFTVGYNGNGEIGNGTVENRTKEWELTGLKVNVDQNNIINLKIL